MEKYLINGGKKLFGTVSVSGAKNAAVAIIPATLIARDKCIIENVPNISDVSIMLRILNEMGAQIKYIDKTTVEIDTSYISENGVPYEMARSLRASYYFLGAMLCRFSEANVALPGGCYFGDRPIDQHIKGFKAIGSEVSIDKGIVYAKAEKLIGNQVFFDVVSVGATMNVMLAAVSAEGTTILENCAKEPHIVDLANFLNSMGADIRGAGTDVIKIRGVQKLHGTTYSIIPDQIEAGTYMVAAAATGGNVLIKNFIPKHLESIIAKIESVGAIVEIFDDSIRVRRENPMQKTNIKTMPHPGFPTDMQPQFAVMLSVAQGTSIVTEGVWDNRYRYIDELRRMGANAQVDGKVAVIEGVDKLIGAPVKATDLRAGAAMLIAGLIADGKTEIEDIYHIERGYEELEEKLRMLGADIKKTNVPGSTVRSVI